MAERVLGEWIRPAGARRAADLHYRVLGRGRVAGGGRRRWMGRAAVADGVCRLRLGLEWMGMTGMDKGGGHE